MANIYDSKRNWIGVTDDEKLIAKYQASGYIVEGEKAVMKVTEITMNQKAKKTEKGKKKFEDTLGFEVLQAGLDAFIETSSSVAGILSEAVVDTVISMLN